MSPRGGPCDHRACLDHGAGCRMLTDDELTPGPEDLALARRLLDEGYVQTSSRYRLVVGPLSLVPPAADLIRPEALDTPAGRLMASDWDRNRGGRLRDLLLHQLLPESAQTALTVKQFAAWKQLRGQQWRPR